MNHGIQKVVILLSAVGTSGCTMFMQTPKFVRFEQPVVVPADDAFRGDRDVQPTWQGRIEAGSTCVYQGRKADVVYVSCPIAIDLRETKVLLPEDQ